MNEPEKVTNTDIMSIYQKSDNILTDIQNIIETSQRQAYRAVETILSQRNWLIGSCNPSKNLRLNRRCGKKRQPCKSAMK